MFITSVTVLTIFPLIYTEKPFHLTSLGTSPKSVKVAHFFLIKDRFGFATLPSICRGEVCHTGATFSVQLFPFWLRSLKECVLPDGSWDASTKPTKESEVR